MSQEVIYLTEATKRLEILVRGSSMKGESPDVSPIQITELPTSPNRLSGYRTFTTDSPVFLDALLPFKNAININMELISLDKPNRYHLGLIVEKNIFPVFTPYTGNPASMVKPSVEYVNAVDQEFLYLKKYSSLINALLQWFSNMKVERGIVDSRVYRQIEVSRLSAPMTRLMLTTPFNDSAQQLSKTLREQTQSLLKAKQEYDAIFNTTSHFGYLNEPVTSVTDCGKLDDLIITN